jgi:hypothetical protein
MANPRHIEWLLEGVDAWNARYKREDFRPDFEGADLPAAFKAAGHDPKERLPLIGADLRGAALQRANLLGADLRVAVLQRADLQGADVSTIVYSRMTTNDSSIREYTDLSTVRSLEQTQLDAMRGDSGTILPEGLTRPAHWPVLDTWQNDLPGDQDDWPEPRAPSPVRFTPPAEFETIDAQLSVQHLPERAAARKASHLTGR